MEPTGFSLDLVLEHDYRFQVRFGEGGPPGLTVDEAPPLGGGAGPNPARLLGLAVGHCLSASLLFCLRKYRIEIPAMRTRVEGTLIRNEKGRLRIGGLKVTLDPALSPADRERAARCLESFQDYCIVTESVRQGVEVEVRVGAEVGAAE
jgi:organic hydroperoxide reductase OsmC/OhrA